MNRKFVIRITLSILALGIGIYFLSQVDYGALFPGTKTEQETREVSPEELQTMMENRARRHSRRPASDEHNHADIPPDTASTSNTDSSSSETIPDRITRRFDATTIQLLQKLEVVYEKPESGKTDFLLKSLEGDSLALGELDGNWRLVNFWATWCAPCREEMPAFSRLQEKLSDRNLDVIGVNLNEPAATVREFVRDHPVDFTILLDKSGAVSRQYGTFSLPETWIIDPTGSVLGSVQGPREWDQTPSLALFKRLTKQN